MLKRIGLGVLCCLIKEVTKIIIHATMTKGKLCNFADKKIYDILLFNFIKD